MGHGTASRLLLAGHKVDAHEAYRLRLVDDVTEAGGAVLRAMAWGLDVAQGAPRAVAELMALLADHQAADLRTRERERFIGVWTSDDHREAVEAFFASRAPVWTGR